MRVVIENKINDTSKEKFIFYVDAENCGKFKIRYKEYQYFEKNEGKRFSKNPTKFYDTMNKRNSRISESYAKERLTKDIENLLKEELITKVKKSIITI